jgi:site-specific DNA recombinase
MEAAVVDQIRTISRDEGIRSEIIRQAMASAEHGKAELEAQKVQLTRQLNRDHSEIRQLFIHKDPNQSITHRIADVQVRIEAAERSLAKVNRELADWEKRELSIQEIEKALIESGNLLPSNRNSASTLQRMAEFRSDPLIRAKRNEEKDHQAESLAFPG